MSSTTLFTLSKSWHESIWLFEQLAFASSGDCILLLQDAVLALESPITLSSFLAKCKAIDVDVVALQEHCELRGIENQHAKLQLVNYQDFVELVVKHKKQVCW